MIKKNLLITTKTLITTMLITLGLMLADNISNIKFTDNIITTYAMEHQNSTNSAGHTLILDDNIWHCYGSDNLIDYTYDGLLLNEYGWWKISNGTVDFSFNELALNEYGWWKITDGAVDFTYNGMTQNEYGNWYVTNGAVDFSYNGMAQNQYGWWYISNGTIDFSFNGMAQNQYGWWYISNGAVDFSYNGMAQNEYGWWEITNGAVDFNFYGISTNIYGSWKMMGGSVNFLYTGSYDCNGIIYNVANGHIEDGIFAGIIVDINLTPVIIPPEPVQPEIPPYEPETPSDEPEIPSDEPETNITNRQLNVDCILQNPELPTGCEVTALAIVLNYYGYGVDKCDLSDYYLDKGYIGETNPNDAFLGEPRYDYSYGCYAPVIVNCANYYLEGDRDVINLTGTSFYDLLDYINNGIPVIVWATTNMNNSYYSTTWDLPDGEFTWKANEHCLVLTGYDYDNGLILVADPLVGNTQYDINVFADRYEQMGCQAVIVI